MQQKHRACAAPVWEIDLIQMRQIEALPSSSTASDSPRPLGQFCSEHLRAVILQLELLLPRNEPSASRTWQAFSPLDVFLRFRLCLARALVRCPRHFSVRSFRRDSPDLSKGAVARRAILLKAQKTGCTQSSCRASNAHISRAPPLRLYPVRLFLHFRLDAKRASVVWSLWSVLVNAGRAIRCVEARADAPDIFKSPSRRTDPSAARRNDRAIFAAPSSRRSTTSISCRILNFSQSDERFPG